MIEEIRKIKISEIDEEISRLEQFPSKYNWIEQNIFKRKEYNEEVQRNKEKIRELQEKREEYEQIQYIQGFGLTLDSAIALMEDRMIQPVLNENDLNKKSWYSTKPDVDELEGVILVHKTDYAPIAERVKSVKEAESYVDDIQTIDGIEIKTKVHRSRNTVHFSVNGEVASHFQGDWEDKKYAILIPITDIPIESIGAMNSADTYTVGGVNLTPNSWIIVPKGEKKTIQQNNPNINIIEYEGKNVTKYANQVVKMLGYHIKEIDKFSFRDDLESQKKFDKLCQKLGTNSESHYYSMDRYNENFETYMQVIIQVIKYVEEHSELLDNKQFLNSFNETLIKLIDKIPFPNNISQGIIDFYNYLISNGFVIPEENIIHDCNVCQSNLQIPYCMAEEIIKLLKNNKKEQKNKEK